MVIQNSRLLTNVSEITKVPLTYQNLIKEHLSQSRKKLHIMSYSDSRGFASRYLNFRTLLVIFITIPTVVLAVLLSYATYLIVINNMNTLVSITTPDLLVVLHYGVLAVVVVVILTLLFAIFKAGGRLYR